MFRMVSDFLLAKVAKFDIIISEVKQGGESNVQIIGKIDTDITSVAKDRKAPSGGKSRTREADDAAIFA